MIRLAFNFYITNVDAHKWPASVVGTIYRIRWQIELIFKQWKSILGIDCLRGSSPNRILCLVYGRLIAVILMSMIYRCLCCYALAVFDREVSVVKLTQWLILRGRLAFAVHNNCCEKLFSELFAAAKRLLKDLRLRRTTLELIDGQVEFQHSFRP